jgi:hypothetical protein
MIPKGWPTHSPTFLPDERTRGELLINNLCYR